MVAVTLLLTPSTPEASTSVNAGLSGSVSDQPFCVTVRSGSGRESSSTVYFIL